MYRFHGSHTPRIIHCALCLLCLPTTVNAERALTVGIAGSNPRGDFSTGWYEGAGLEGNLQWTYVRSIEASVSLSLLNHLPKEDEDPEVLLGVWTLGMHWRPRLSSSWCLDLMFGAQSHTALFHQGFDIFRGNKGFDESDLGFCVGVGLERWLSPRWRARIGIKTNTIFTQPEWVRYETLSFGLTHGLWL